MGGARRVAMDVLGVVASYVCLVMACAVMTSGGSVVFSWLYPHGSAVSVLLIPLYALVAPLVWLFSLGDKGGSLGMPPVTLILPLACLFLCGLAGGIAGNRKEHPYIGFILGLVPGMILGASLMAWLCHRMGVIC